MCRRRRIIFSVCHSEVSKSFSSLSISIGEKYSELKVFHPSFLVSAEKLSNFREDLWQKIKLFFEFFSQISDESSNYFYNAPRKLPVVTVTNRKVLRLFCVGQAKTSKLFPASRLKTSRVDHKFQFEKVAKVSIKFIRLLKFTCFSPHFVAGFFGKKVKSSKFQKLEIEKVRRGKFV